MKVSINYNSNQVKLYKYLSRNKLKEINNILETVCLIVADLRRLVILPIYFCGCPKSNCRVTHYSSTLLTNLVVVYLVKLLFMQHEVHYLVHKILSGLCP